jgi:putative inorganic carbon (hco3(-)) transporter
MRDTERLVPPPFLKKLSLWFAAAAAIAILVSIAISQTLLAVAIGILLLSGLPLRWPRIAFPLGLFLIWTFISLAFSPDPASGLTQVRKIFVFLTMLTVFSSVRNLADAKLLVFGWVGVGTYTAGLGIFQFARKWAEARAAHRDFYHFYVADRITGFQDHWMTFSGQELFLLLMLTAYLLFGPDKKIRLRLWLPCALVVGTALVLSNTRSIWIAAIVAGFYLLWEWKRVAALAMPVLVVLTLLVAPAAIQQRAWSLIHPEAQTDSNTHRMIVWRTGWEIIKAHPLLGLGPEEISKPANFYAYLPKDIPRPLPPGYYQHLHSIYIHYAAERGVPAALFLVGALVLAILDFRRALRTIAPGRSYRRFLLQWSIASVIGTMVAGIADLNLGLSDVLTMFLVVVCLGYWAAAEPSDVMRSGTAASP